jgi:hypothetical protein
VKNRITKGVTMNMIVPGGFEQFFVEIDQLPKDQPLDRQQVAEIGSRYGLRFLPDENWNRRSPLNPGFEPSTINYQLLTINNEQ